MNVIVTNEQQQKLAVLDVDIIKNIQGNYTAFEIVEMFKDFFCEKIILDVTSIKDYNNIQAYQVLAKGLGPEKLVLFLPEGTNLCTPQFLAPLVTLGIYNFTTNTDGVKDLLKKPNTLQDVEHIQKMGGGGVIRDPNKQPDKTEEKKDATFAMNTIIGVKNATEHAGSTTLTYMMKKELNIHELREDQRRLKKANLLQSMNALMKILLTIVLFGVLILSVWRLQRVFTRLQR